MSNFLALDTALEAGYGTPMPDHFATVRLLDLSAGLEQLNLRAYTIMATRNPTFKVDLTRFESSPTPF